MASTAIFTVMCFAMGQWEVNLPTVSALLTAFSYAINDCVVVFDRIRFEASKPCVSACFPLLMQLCCPLEQNCPAPPCLPAQLAQSCMRSRSPPACLPTSLTPLFMAEPCPTTQPNRRWLRRLTMAAALTMLPVLRLW
jgi:hypothetical protein